MFGLALGLQHLADHGSGIAVLADERSNVPRVSPGTPESGKAPRDILRVTFFFEPIIVVVFQTTQRDLDLAPAVGPGRR